MIHKSLSLLYLVDNDISMGAYSLVEELDLQTLVFVLAKLQMRSPVESRLIYTRTCCVNIHYTNCKLLYSYYTLFYKQHFNKQHQAKNDQKLR